MKNMKLKEVVYVFLLLDTILFTIASNSISRNTFFITVTVGFYTFSVG